MRKFFIAALLAVMALTLSACLPLAILAADEIPGREEENNAPQTQESAVQNGGKESIVGDGEKHEALDWLSENNSVSALASNRFYTTDEAVGFVKSLYAAGAVTVWVTGIFDEASRLETEEGPYADALIVELPEDTARKEKLYGIYKREVMTFGCNESDEASGYRGNLLYLWWD